MTLYDRDNATYCLISLIANSKPIKLQVSWPPCLYRDWDDSALDGEEREVSAGEPHDVAQPEDLSQWVLHRVIDGRRRAWKKEMHWSLDVVTR